MITITDNEFTKLADYIKDNCGIYLKKEKQSLVCGRLQKVLLQNGIQNFSQYYDYILHDSDGNAVETFVDKITTNYTFFMREPDHFTYFQDNVLPELTKKITDKDLRIWSAGCSTGEEPYTLAMILDEFFGIQKNEWDCKVLATDISRSVLDVAKKGMYDDEKVAALPLNWKTKYFSKYGNEQFIISEKIRNEVIFRKFNLMNLFPFKKKFHVIFCRNVMIYFNYETRTKLIDKYCRALEPGGYLFIGHSETIGRDNTGLKYIKPSVYQKI